MKANRLRLLATGAPKQAPTTHNKGWEYQDAHQISKLIQNFLRNVLVVYCNLIYQCDLSL